MRVVIVVHYSIRAKEKYCVKLSEIGFAANLERRDMVSQHST
jgi:hypothetical protein